MEANIENSKLYMRYDLQDETDFEIETLEQMREWLAGFWNSNPDEEMSDKEHDRLIENIMNSDAEELGDRLEGIDYTYEELDEEAKKEFGVSG